MRQILIIFSFSFLVVGCADEQVQINSPELFSPVIGPEGGTVTFYTGGIPGESRSQGPNDNKEAVIQLEIPEGALNSEVRFMAKRRYLQNLENSLGTEFWQVEPSNIEFSKPVTYTVKYDNTIESKEYGCFGKFLYIRLDQNLIGNLEDPKNWEELVDVVDVDENFRTITVQTTKLDKLYSFGVQEDLTNGYYSCSEVDGFMEVPLGDRNNILAINLGGVEFPFKVDVQEVPLERASNQFLRSVDQYYILASSNIYDESQPHVGIPNAVLSENMTLNDSSRLFLRASGPQLDDVWINWQEINDEVRILRLDPISKSVIEVIEPEDFPNVERAYRLFQRNVINLGWYVLAVPKTLLKSWVGGEVTITASGPSIDTVMTFINEDFGGVAGKWIDIFLDDRDSLSYSKVDFRFGQGKDLQPGQILMGFSDYRTIMRFPDPFIFSDDKDYFDLRFKDKNGNENFIGLKDYGADLEIVKQEGPAGVIEGVILSRTGGAEHCRTDGNGNCVFQPIDLVVEFRLKNYTWEE